jgi:DNA primase
VRSNIQRIKQELLMIPTDFTDTIKRTVTARDVATRYGLPFTRHGFANCPFHGEKMPSMKLYEGIGKDGFYCFGCHVGGSVIDLTMKLLGLDFGGAIRRLNSDFALGLPLDRELSPAERARAERLADTRRKQRDARERRESIVGALYDLTARHYLFLLQLADRHRPTPAEPEFDDFWCFAQMELPDAKDRYERMEDERCMICQK